MDITTKVKLKDYLIKCSNCSHAITTYQKNKKYYHCPKNGGTYPSGSQFEQCKYYDDKKEEEKK